MALIGKDRRLIGPALALASAVLFGISTPAAKVLVGAIDLLNLEGVLTALIAWVVVREHAHVRIVGGMVVITAGALILAWNPGAGAVIALAAGASWPQTRIARARGGALHDRPAHFQVHELGHFASRRRA